MVERALRSSARAVAVAQDAHRRGVHLQHSTESGVWSVGVTLSYEKGARGEEDAVNVQ